MSILVKNGGNKMINTKRTKIVCTIGPATNDVEILKIVLMVMRWLFHVLPLMV